MAPMGHYPRFATPHGSSLADQMWLKALGLHGRLQEAGHSRLPVSVGVNGVSRRRGYERLDPAVGLRRARVVVDARRIRIYEDGTVGRRFVAEHLVELDFCLAQVQRVSGLEGHRRPAGTVLGQDRRVTDDEDRGRRRLGVDLL